MHAKDTVQKSKNDIFNLYSTLQSVALNFDLLSKKKPEGWLAP